MRAAIARRGQMVVEDVPDPVPGPGDALVEVKACGICGSDLHTLHHADSLLAVAELSGGESQLRPEADFVMGHEFSAEVRRARARHRRRRRSQSGDLVVSMPFALADGAPGCEPIGFSNTYNGGYADRMRLTAGHVPQGPERARRAPRRAHRADDRRTARGEQVRHQAGRGRARARVRPGRPRGDRRAEVEGHRADRGCGLLRAPARDRDGDGCARGRHPDDRDRDRRVAPGRWREAGRDLRGDRDPRDHRPGDARRAAAQPDRDRRRLHGDRPHAPARRDREGAEPAVHLLLRPDEFGETLRQHRGGRARRHADAHRRRRRRRRAGRVRRARQPRGSR